MSVYTVGNCVYYENGVFLGDIVVGVSGEPLFFKEQDGTRGGWPAHLLRTIADELDKRNIWIRDPTMVEGNIPERYKEELEPGEDRF